MKAGVSHLRERMRSETNKKSSLKCKIFHQMFFSLPALFDECFCGIGLVCAHEDLKLLKHGCSWPVISDDG